MRTVWRSLIQCHLDYGNLLWAPYNEHGDNWKWSLLESPLREFTRKASGLKKENYWSRLKFFKLSSMQRRVERYRIVYSWKSLNGFAPSLGLMWSNMTTGRSGRTLEVRRVTGSSVRCKTMRRQSIQYEGVKLLNCLPTEIRNFSGSIENFKKLIDNFLDLVPDEPMTDTLSPSVQNIDGKFSNSIYDWCRTKSFTWEPNLELTRIYDSYIVKPSGGEAQLNHLWYKSQN